MNTEPQKAVHLTSDSVGGDLPPALPRWEPIETAPKNAHILAAVDGLTRVVRWGKTSHVSMYGFCLADQGAEEFDLCYPTHWMPLPLPPGEATGYPCDLAEHIDLTYATRQPGEATGAVPTNEKAVISDLLTAAKCAKTILFLLQDEVKALGHRAGNVQQMLADAITKAEN